MPNSESSLPEEVYRRFVVAIEDKLNDWGKIGLFSKDFPDSCPDNQNLIVNNYDNTRLAKIFYTETGITLGKFKQYPSENGVIEIVKFLYRHSSEPMEKDYHGYFEHFHLTQFSSKRGKKKIEKDMNSLLSSVGLNLQLSQGNILRKENEIFAEIVEMNHFKTKDAQLDDLLNSSISHFKDPSFESRKVALVKIWGAWERLISLYGSGNKQEGVNKLIKDAVKEERFREVLKSEAGELQKIGNNFQIRHYDLKTIAITSVREIDYFYFRLYNLIDFLLHNRT